MPKFMRKQARDHKAGLEKGLELAKRQKQALRLPKEGKKSMREIALITTVDKTTLSSIRCLRNNDEPALRMMLSPSTYKTGASTVLTAEEEAMIFDCLIFAGKRRLAVRKNALKSIMMQISLDGRPS